MPKSRNMSIQFIGGVADGVRICRCTGRQIVTIVIPRDFLPDAKRINNLPERGIYYLLKLDRGGVSKAYAGQTTQGLKRLDDHKANKDWWDVAVMHLVSHEALTLDIVNGLESHAITLLAKSGCASANAKPNIIHVNEFDIPAIEELYEDISFRMEALGFALVPPCTEKPETTVFHAKKRGVHGIGTYDSEREVFTLLPGCEIDLSCKPIRDNVRSDIMELLDKDGRLTLPVEFTSPSAAATAVLGGSQNGWTEWVDDEGRTLDVVYRSKED